MEDGKNSTEKTLMLAVLTQDSKESWMGVLIRLYPAF